MSLESEVQQRLARIRAQQGLQGDTFGTPGGLQLESDWLPHHMKVQQGEGRDGTLSSDYFQEASQNPFQQKVQGVNEQAASKLSGLPTENFEPPAWYQSQHRPEHQLQYQKMQEEEELMQLLPLLMSDEAESQMLEQQIEEEEERTRMLLNTMRKIKEDEEAEELRLEEEEVRFHFETLLENLQYNKEQEEQKRRREMEERQMKNMEMLVRLCRNLALLPHSTLSLAV